MAAAAVWLVAGFLRDQPKVATAVWLAAFAFLSVGCLIWLANCMLTESTWRFGIPVWQNSQIALLASLDLIVRARQSTEVDANGISTRCVEPMGSRCGRTGWAIRPGSGMKADENQ